jgi:hypothetical protein
MVFFYYFKTLISFSFLGDLLNISVYSNFTWNISGDDINSSSFVHDNGSQDLSVYSLLKVFDCIIMMNKSNFIGFIYSFIYSFVCLYIFIYIGFPPTEKALNYPLEKESKRLENEDEPVDNYVCSHLPSSMIILNSSYFKCFSSIFKYSEIGGFYLFFSSYLSLNECIFSTNQFYSSLFPSMRSNINCSSGEENENSTNEGNGLLNVHQNIVEANNCIFEDDLLNCDFDDIDSVQSVKRKPKLFVNEDSEDEKESIPYPYINSQTCFVHGLFIICLFCFYIFYYLVKEIFLNNIMIHFFHCLSYRMQHFLFGDGKMKVLVQMIT